jgi:hypothetical protein
MSHFYQVFLDNGVGASVFCVGEIVESLGKEQGVCYALTESRYTGVVQRPIVFSPAVAPC